ncbi:hypothetical protein BS47DRAFT_1145679 [Hydnum rufescens UP504]|uniref:Uncharacterized protein n=1 Tax=Hydnum rufescens UP504 TaxID=1448309 RepID=A0A9P6ATH8_9AGAM|nr:hypothetical protein BS47DRAFT_1145679 [Hydnum rufescens UP504]
MACTSATHVGSLPRSNVLTNLVLAVSSASSSPQPATSTEFSPSLNTITSTSSNTQHSPDETDPADPFIHPESNVDPSVNTSPSQKPPDEPFLSYSRRVLVFLSKSPLVSPPPTMPSLKDWFGEWAEPHTSPKKDSEHASSSGGLANGRHRLRRDQTEDDSRPSYKSQFSQASQMGNFRHHSLASTRKATVMPTKVSEICLIHTTAIVF